MQNSSSQDEALPHPSVETSPTSLEIDYDSEVSSSLFKSKGYLMLQGNRSLPYLILNATLLKAGKPISSTKYMMMEIEPNRENSFDISKNMRISPGSYSCILEVSGPSGQVASETRECHMMEPFFAKSPVPKPELKSPLSKPLIPEIPTAKPSSLKPSPIREEDLPLPSGRPEEAAKSAEWKKEDDKVSSDNILSEDEDMHKEGVGSNDSEKSLEGQDQEATASAPGVNASQYGSLVGSTTSNKYHLPSCRFAAKIRPENRIYFANEEDAKKKGYISCKTCNP